MQRTIPLARPQLGDEEIAAVTQVLSSGRLSLGQQRELFEREFANCVGAEFAAAVSSGTAALHLAVRACGIGHGDEVITSPFSFVATSNCLLYEQARPVFVDIDAHSLNINASQIAAAITSRTRAIIAVDIFGYPAKWSELQEIGQRYKLQVIEDAAQALGAQYGDKKIGSLGHPTVFSFYPNKQITTAEGGMLVTNDESQYHLVQSLSNQGRGPDLQHLDPQRLGFNYRMNELSAALGRVQLNRLSDFLCARRKIAGFYKERLQGIEGLILPVADDERHKRSWFCYVVRLPSSIERSSVIKCLANEGIASKAYLPAIHLMPHLKAFGYKAGDFPVAESVANTSLALPFYVGMHENDVDRVASVLTATLAKLRR